jgi:serine/threonine-protein kinase
MIDDLKGKVIADKYSIEAILRDSDLGTIYHAWHITLDKPATVKVLAQALAVDKRFVDRFLNEAKTTQQAAHPHILNVTDFGTDPRGISYTVYEGVAGETLDKLIERDSTLPVSDALSIARHAASAIASAHAKGLRHGGLTAEKIFVSYEDERPIVKVFDFGVQPVGWNSDAEIEYLAPEQYADTNRGDARSDIYSLGVVLYEMLAGYVPYKGSSINELRTRQSGDQPASLTSIRSDLPADLEPMVLSTIALEPDKRYQSMRSFAEDLQLLSGEVEGPKKAAAPRRNIWQTAAFVSVGILLLAGALIYATSVKRTDPTTQLHADAGSLPVQPIGPATGAQEESLARMPAMTDAEIMAAQNANTMTIDTLPGGDGYNPWANGGAPPLGAPPAQSIPPGGQLGVPPGGQSGGQYVTIDPNGGGSQFMPQDGGVILVPVPVEPSPKATPKTQPANAAVKNPAAPASTAKPLATPPKDDKSAAAPASKEKPAEAKPKAGKPKE